MKPTLLVLAAGMGSRYGGLKQIDGVGPKGETIIDYSIYDALRAGFGKIVFVIRRDIEADFKAVFGTRFSGRAELAYAFQERTVLLDHWEFFREKPWGTAHAVLAAKDIINEPFAVINADDFYGRASFERMSAFLKNKADENHYAMIGFVLENTLSENGTVSRGVCDARDTSFLRSIAERTKIEKRGDTIFYEEKGKAFPVPETALVSMNFWGFQPSVFGHIEKGFDSFVRENIHHPKAEYYIPLVVNELIEKRKVSVEVLPTESQWYGVTYQKDKPGVQAAIAKLIEAGEYPDSLWDVA